ncbi:MAG TPA: nicotinate-nucleotide adenylyltransferase [Gammaproteobacteria bacterium]|nr:nicotinate-nucleotide adenylyltransferase [Gammaproteobacteria bacterium]
MTAPIGILGGTFDPVHHGHLRLAIECLERVGLQEVRLVPLYTPPHRQSPRATPEHRLAMLKLAVENIDGLNIDESELHREGVSYTVKTVSSLRQKLGDTPVCLVMGADAFGSLNTWRDWKSLLDYVHIVIAARSFGPSFLADELQSFAENHIVSDIQALHNNGAGKIYKLAVPLLDISATQIRRILADGLDENCLLPVPVMEYIHTHKLYDCH